MIELFSEYLFCLLYTTGLFICVYPYIEKKRSIIFTLVFLMFYGLIDLIITGDYILELHEYLITNMLVVISDFIMICIFEKKYNPHVLFYTTFYFCIYVVVVNSIIYIYSQSGISVPDIYGLPFIRAILVFIYIIITVLLFKILEKLGVIPDKNIVNKYPYVFDFVNIIVLSSYIVFFGFSLIEIDTVLIIFIFVIFIFLWFGLLALLNKTILLIDENSNLLLMSMANKNAETLLENFNKDKEETAKIKHDINNHLQIIKGFNDIESARKYVDEIIDDSLKVDYLVYDSGSKTIDTILSLKTFQYKDINFIINIDFENYFITQKDMATILFNLIDNASQNISFNNKNVNIEILQHEQAIVITVTNHVDKKPSFVSKRGKDHGYGLKIIKSIVDKYNGDLSIEYDHNMVIVQIII